MHDLAHFAQTALLTVGLAVLTWIGVYGAIGLINRAARGLASMIHKHRTKIDRRTFPVIAWGILALVVAFFVILVIARVSRGA